LGWRPRPGKVAQKVKTSPQCDISHAEPPTQNKKKLKSELQDLLNP